MKRLLLLLALSTACESIPAPPATEPVEQPTEKPTPVPTPKPVPPKAPPFAENVQCGGKTWKPEWNEAIASELDKNGNRLMMAEIELLCPNYMKSTDAEKKAFWALFFATVACRESGFDPAQFFMEPAPLNKYSIGLLQLSYGDERGHSRCNIVKTGTVGGKPQGNLTDGVANLRCGVVILDDQMKQWGTLFTQNSYWSVLRPEKAGKGWSASKTKELWWKWAPKLPFCKAAVQ